ncbi:MAG: DUF4179 domain-containing protein [Oscillospiraceae bacterium]|nr:DUF4179 domain-containing protein [Oscillospiraceae bacterium]
MSKRLKELGISTDLKIDAQRIATMSNQKLDAIPSERKTFMKYKKTKIVVIAAVITILFIVTAFAADNIISYFGSSEAKKVGDIDTLTKYNEQIGVVGTLDDKTLVLDNIAVDDSYLYVFFTLTAPEDYEFDVICRINGTKANNWSNWDNYMIDDYTGKGVIKISVAQTDIPDEFTFEMYSVEQIDEEFEDYYYQDYLELTEEDKANLLYVSTIAHKAEIKANTLTKEVNVEIPALNSVLNKVVISPFGSQLVITQNEINRRYLSDCFALTDETGNFIHVMPESTRIYNEGDTKEVRTVPFMPGERIPESLTIIPYGEPEEMVTVDGENKAADEFPVELNIADHGKIIVTDVRYLDAKIEIDYYITGNSHGLQMIYPVNNEGYPEMLSDDGVWWLHETEYHQMTKSYTAVFRFVIGDADNNGNVPSAGSMRSADILREKYPNIGISYQSNIPELDYNNAVTVDLK